MVKEYKNKNDNSIVKAVKFTGWNSEECFCFLTGQPLFWSTQNFEDTFEVLTPDGKLQKALVDDYFVKTQDNKILTYTNKHFIETFIERQNNYAK